MPEAEIRIVRRTQFIVANSPEQAYLYAASLDNASNRVHVIRADVKPNLLGMRMLPENVLYAPGWELGRYAADVLASLRRNYAGMLAAA